MLVPELSYAFSIIKAKVGLDLKSSKMIEFANEPIIPAPLLTGKDLIEFGWAPGPNLGETLNSVQDLQLEGTLNSKEEALEWVKANRSKK